MFERIFQMIAEKCYDASVTAKKFERFERVCSKKPITIIRDQSNASPELNYMPVHWKSSHDVLALETSYEPCVVYPPESLLQVGSAEKFLICKLNPIDEFKHLRETRRREDALRNTVARFKTKRKSA